MRRIVSVWLPTWPTDRIRRGNPESAPSPETPLITSGQDGPRRVVAAADRAALALGVRPGMKLATAQAMRRGLEVREADPLGDAAALARLAGWCLGFSPLTSPDAPDGLWIDATGGAHLFGGEQAMLGTIAARLRDAGFAARAAMADTPGAAHAVARCGPEPETVVPPGATRQAIAGLPVSCLRLPADMLDRLRRLGFDRVSQLIEAPRAPLARRFGVALARRLDQAMGRVFEPIEPVLPADVLARREVFVEPLLTEAAFGVVIERLVGQVCVALEQAGQGARRLDLVFERVDGATPAIRVGTTRASRDPVHLARMLRAELERVDPGLGIEAMRLVVPLAEVLAYTQSSPLPLREGTGEGFIRREVSPAKLPVGGTPPPSPPSRGGGKASIVPLSADVAALVDRLQSRLGAARVYRAAPVESDVPERGVAYIPASSPPTGRLWPADLPRPARLLDPPQPIEAMALLPDHPPRAFTWRQHRHRVRRADGPERITGEWWKRRAETWAVRDYFTVEDETGRRFWLFRRGDGADPATGDQSWYLHGLF